VRIWQELHEKTWRYRYECKGELLTPKNGVAYGPKYGDGQGFESASAARAELIKAMEQDYA
jgi:hypothetical protein